MSSDTPSLAEPVEESVTPPPSPSAPSAGRWAIALFIATLAAWTLFNFAPLIQTPEELLGVDLYSPIELQRAADESAVELYWKNALIRFTLAGLCFGAVTLLAADWSRLRSQAARIAVGLVSGIVCGVAAALLGILVKWQLNKETPLPLVDESLRPLLGDMMMFVLMSVLLVLPIALPLFMGGPQSRQKAMAIPLAAVIVGLLFPIVASLALPTAPTDIFPPRGLGLTAFWFALLALLVFGIPMLTGTRERKDVESAAPQAS